MTNDPLRGNTTMMRYVLVAGAVLGGLCLVLGGVSWFRLLEQERRLQDVQQAAVLAQKDRDPRALQTLQAAAATVKELAVPLDDLEYAHLHARWLENLQQFDGLLAARGNRYVAATFKDLVAATRKGLLDLRGECSSYLQHRPDHSTPPATWKIYNLRGCLAVMAAYISLEFDEDGREAGKFLNDAIEDYKAALKSAEVENASTYERMLPGWNLELIVGSGDYFVVGQSIMEENMSKVEEQLEPVLPNFGGYSPGAPLDIYVDK
jgi:hypothetical protein